jgi:hypothetical protein
MSKGEIYIHGRVVDMGMRITNRGGVADKGVFFLFLED